MTSSRLPRAVKPRKLIKELLRKDEILCNHCEILSYIHDYYHILYQSNSYTKHSSKAA
jgi:hypothetical protein